MIILGIDPGITAAGYSLIDCRANKIKILAAGILKVEEMEQQDRLYSLHKELKHILDDWRPQVLAVEKLFFTKNQKTAIQVAEARGVILLTTALAKLKVYEYTPLEVKKIVTGDGSADKLQLRKMIEITFPETKKWKVKDDVFDALGIALTCFYLEKPERKI